MRRKDINPNTPELWDRLLFEKNRELLASDFYKDKINRIYKFLKNRKGRFLDVGVGMGNLESKMLRDGTKLDIHGVDISPKAIFRAKKRLKGQFYISRAESLPFKDSYFDVVALIDVLEHVDEAKSITTLRESNRVLKRHGHLIVSVPINEDLVDLIRTKRNTNEHMREFTPEILGNELALADFSVIKKDLLYAFSKFYYLKSLIMRFIPGYRKPNLLIMFSRKK